MEMGVNRGQPPGTVQVQVQGYQNMPNQPFQGYPNQEAGYFQVQTRPAGPQQQQAMYQASGAPQAQMMSPNQALPFHKQGIVGYPSNQAQGINMQHPIAGQFGVMPKKGVYTNDCSGQGSYNVQQVGQAMMYSPVNGVSGVQAVHHAGPMSGQTGKYMEATVMQGQIHHAPGQAQGQGQFHGHMMYQGQVCPQQQQQQHVVWYQDGTSGMSSPPSGVSVRYSGNHGNAPGNRPLRMMSPTPQPMARSPQQPAQVRPMVMSPGGQNAMLTPRTPHMQPQQLAMMGPRVMHAMSRYSPPASQQRQTMGPASNQKYQQPRQQQPFQQYAHQQQVGMHGGQQVVPPRVQIPCNNQYIPQGCVSNQHSPGIPYSQALEGYPSPKYTEPHIAQTRQHRMPTPGYDPGSNNDGHQVEPYTVPGVQPAIARSIHSSMPVYTMANTQPLQTTTASAGTTLHGEHKAWHTPESACSNVAGIHKQHTAPGSYDHMSQSSPSRSHTPSTLSTPGGESPESVSAQGLYARDVHSSSSETLHTAFADTHVTKSKFKEEASRTKLEQCSPTSHVPVDASELPVCKSEHSKSKCIHKLHSNIDMDTSHHNKHHTKLHSSELDSKATVAEQLLSPSATSSLMDTDCQSFGSQPGSARESSIVPVPFGWRRELENGAVVYYSPNQTPLSSTRAIIQYLVTDGTCKCGLSCPLTVEKTFNFDPELTSRSLTPDDIKSNDDDLNNLCNHKRKMIAMATLQTTTNLKSSNQFADGQKAASKVLEALSQNKKDGNKKKKSKVKARSSPCDGMSVSQLLLHRQKLREMEVTSSLAFTSSVGMQQHGSTEGFGDQQLPVSQHMGPAGCGAMARQQFEHGAKIKYANSGMSDSCEEVKIEASAPAHVGAPVEYGDHMQISPNQSCSNPQAFFQQQRMRGVDCSDRKVQYGMQGPGNGQQFMHHGSRMHRPQHPFDMMMNSRQKHHGQMPDGVMGHGQGQGQMPFVGQGGCVPPSNQMFSLQLQMQAQAAAARNAGANHRFGMPSPGMSSPSQQSSPSPGQLHVHGKLGEMKSPPPFYDQSSPSPTMGPYRNPGNPGPAGHVLSPPRAIPMPQSSFCQPTVNGPNPDEPPSKKKKKKKKKKDANNAMGSLLDRNMPCPNVDVRQFIQKHNSPQMGQNPGLMSMSGQHMSSQSPKMASFMENPAAFLAQQTEMMTNKLQSTFSGDIPLSGSVSNKGSGFLHNQMAGNSLPDHAMGNTACANTHTPLINNALSHNIKDEIRDVSYATPGRSPLREEDTLAGILSQDSSQSQANSHKPSESSPQEHNNTDSLVKGHDNQSSKEFPASCLLSATARAKLVHPECTSGESSVQRTPQPSSWGNPMLNRFKMPSGPAPIRHVPPGGQHIGGGSIVYHHNIENQQAFQEGGIVNGGGILMVSGPANRGESLLMNCLPAGPLLLQGAVANKGMLGEAGSYSTVGMPLDPKNMTGGLTPSKQGDVSVIKNLLQTSIQEQFHNNMSTAMTAKETSASPIQMVQNLISGIGSSNSRSFSNIARGMFGPVGIGSNAQMPRFPCEPTEPGAVPNSKDASVQMKVMMHVDVSEDENHLEHPSVNLPMPPLSVDAVTAVTNSITQVIPAVGMQVQGCIESASVVPETLQVISTACIAPEESSKGNPENNPTDNLTASPHSNNDVDESGFYNQGHHEHSEHFEPEDYNTNVQEPDKSHADDNDETRRRPSSYSNSCQIQTTGTLKVKVLLKGKKKKKKKKGKKSKSSVLTYVVEPAGPQTSRFLADDLDTTANVGHPEMKDTDLDTAQDATLGGSLNSTAENDNDRDFEQKEEVEREAPEYDEVMTTHGGHILEHSPGQVLFAQNQAYSHQLLQGQSQGQGPDQPLVCITTQCQGQGQLAIAQGQTTNIIQTVSFVPNMVGIDPSTGLVQSIQVPVAATADTSKDDQPGIPTEQVSPAGHTQVVQTVMQSLHIQNNVLVQGMAAAPGTFLQPLGAMGNTLIPIFPSPVAVATSSEEAPLSMMQINSSSASQLSPYVEPSRPNSNVVSTQTEAVQTEDSCSDLVDAEGGGRLFVESEEGILADEEDLQSSLGMLPPEDEVGSRADLGECSTHESESQASEPSEGHSSSVSVSSNDGQPRETHQSRQNATKQKQDEVVGSKASKYLDNTDPSQESESPSNESWVSQDDKSPSVSNENPNASSDVLGPRMHHMLKSNTSGAEEAHVDPRGADDDEGGDQDFVGDSSIAPAIYSEVSQSDNDTRCTTFSESMPVLSREGSSRDLSAVERKIVPAMVIVHKHLEETVRSHQDDHDLDLTLTKFSKFCQRTETTPTKEFPQLEPVVREGSEDPPKLSVIQSFDHSIKKRGPILKKNKKHKRSRFRKVKNSRISVRNTRSVFKNSYSRIEKVQASSTTEEVLLNNNKPPDTSEECPAEDPTPTPPPAEQANSPVPMVTVTGDAEKAAETQEAEQKDAKAPQKTSTSSGGSSDGEANQSSDSSQSNASSEGDEVRCGNSPSIRCSNLLSSSPENSDLNCNSHSDFDKLANLEDKIFVEGGMNHVRTAASHMKTRRSIRAELDEVLPRRGVKRPNTEEPLDDDEDVDPTSDSSPQSSSPRVFNVGDLVWGPIKNFPSWPGKIVPQQNVPKNPKSEADKLWVRWFGNHTFTQVEPALLKTLSEGFEAHHTACEKQRKGRKMNPNLVAAIEEAMMEFDRPITEAEPPPKVDDIPIPPKVPKVKKVISKKKKLK